MQGLGFVHETVRQIRETQKEQAQSLQPPVPQLEANRMSRTWFNPETGQPLRSAQNILRMQACTEGNKLYIHIERGKLELGHSLLAERLCHRSNG